MNVKIRPAQETHSGYTPYRAVLQTTADPQPQVLCRARLFELSEGQGKLGFGITFTQQEAGLLLPVALSELTVIAAAVQLLHENGEVVIEPSSDVAVTKVYFGGSHEYVAIDPQLPDMQEIGKLAVLGM